MNIEVKIKQTISKYKLLSKKDKVVVALSGGKDSTSVIYILKKLGYNVHGLLIDLYLGGWSKTHNDNMARFCSEIGVPFTIVDLKKEMGQGICFIKAVLKKEKNLTGCSVCGTVKRWILNKWARKLGADKLVTGHNLDDEAQNVLMNFLKGNVLLGANSGPMTGSAGFSSRCTQSSSGVIQAWSLTHPGQSKDQDDRTGETFINSSKCINKRSLSRSMKLPNFIQRVKPLFFVPESEIMKYAKKKKFDILYDKCPCAFGTYRVETRGWMVGISDAEKKKIVENFQKVVPRLKSGDSRELRVCKKCGEPSTGSVCNFCKVVGCL